MLIPVGVTVVTHFLHQVICRPAAAVLDSSCSVSVLIRLAAVTAKGALLVACPHIASSASSSSVIDLVFPMAAAAGRPPSRLVRAAPSRAVTCLPSSGLTNMQVFRCTHCLAKEREQGPQASLLRSPSPLTLQLSPLL